MSKGSVRTYAVDYVGKGKNTADTAGGGNVVLNAGVHALDGPEHTHLDAYVKSTLGGEETVADTVTGAAVTIDAADGNWADIALTADCTVTVTGFTSGFGCSVLVRFTQDAGAGHAIIWDADVVFQSGVDDQPGQGSLEETWFVLWSMDGDGSIRAAPVGGGGGGPDLSAIDFLVGTASGDLSAEIVVGTTPGGQLAGTASSWASPVVTDTHGSTPNTHAATQAAAEATAAAALAAHVASGGGGDHVHVVDEQFSGDASAVDFNLANSAVPDSVMAYVSGTRTPVTLGGTLNDVITFGSAPASASLNISVDYAAVLE